MRLFDIDPETSQVLLNKPWIMLVPEFKTLFERDKGSKGDYRGDKKLKATRELTFIYFFTDFASPLTDWEDSEKRKEALYYAGLEEKDLDDKVLLASAKYDEMQLKGARALRTYRALVKMQNAMDTYYETLDMSKLDRKGSLVNDPASVTASVKKLSEMYNEINSFRKRTELELKDESTGIRGTATLGDNEEKIETFSELDVITGSQHAAGEKIREGSGTMDKMLHRLQEIAPKLELTVDQVLSSPGEEEDD